jgi:methionyl-tRNA formyltransferase
MVYNTSPIIPRLIPAIVNIIINAAIGANINVNIPIPKLVKIVSCFILAILSNILGINTSIKIPTSIMFNKLSILGSEMIKEFIPRLINGDFTPIKQDNNKATYAYNITKEDEKINFNDNSINIYNKIRGLSEVPGGYAFLEGKRVKIFNSRIGKEANGNPGEIINIYEDGIGIMTSDKEIVITDIQVEGKTRELVKDYLHGIQDKNKLIGKIFD